MATSRDKCKIALLLTVVCAALCAKEGGGVGESRGTSDLPFIASNVSFSAQDYKWLGES